MDDKKKYSFASIVMLCFAVIDSVRADSDNIEFETRALDLRDDQSINLSNFSRPDYIPAGSYPLTLKLNERIITSDTFEIINVNNHSKVCFPEEIVEKFNLKMSTLATLMKRIAPAKTRCVLIDGYEGITVHVDRNKSILLVGIPQALLQYSDPDWTPPSQWDDGVPGILLDYTLNGNIYHSRNSANNRTLSSYGTAGANYNSWRLRSNYQASFNDSGYGSTTRQFRATSFYATRALKESGASLTIGKSNLQSDLFDSLNYTGVAIVSDDRMLPPALRGYAPVLRGVANSNARITVSRGDNILYEKMVPPGEFVIQDLPSTAFGQLRMTIREENGTERVSTVETSDIPFLTRSGHIRYKAMAGRMNQTGGPFNPFVGSGEISFGILTGTSLYGGAIITDKQYYAFNSGIGYDMNQFGAVSVDVTHARSQLTDQRLQGQSYRFNYSKVFDSIDSQITFAGYRFSEKNYLSLDNFVAMKLNPSFATTNKESYNLVASKNFQELGISINATYNRQTYWQDISDSNSYGLSVSKSFDIGSLKNISAYLSVNRTEYKTSFLEQEQRNDNTVYLSFNIPLMSHSYLSTGMRMSRGRFSPSTFYTHGADPRNVWSVGTNTSNAYEQSNLNGNIVQNRDSYSSTFNTSLSKDDYYLSGSFKSGITATAHGVAAHRDGYAGNTRLMVDTNGIEGIYIGNRGNSTSRPTNAQGVSVISNVPDYYRTDYAIDTNRLPDDVESSNANIQTVLTEGAIGYRKLNIYRGIKALLKLTDSQGRVIPFGTQIEDSQERRQVGVVGENGEVYVSGVAAQSRLTALNSDGQQCVFTLPDQSFSLSVFYPLVCNIGS